MLIGISGAICSGKHTFATLLDEMFECSIVSLSALVEQDVRGTDRPPSRKNLQEVANTNRNNFGSAFYVKKAIKESMAASTPSDHSTVLVGIYSQGEAQHILQEGGQLILLRCADTGHGLEASRHLRFERLIMRARLENRLSDLLSYEGFCDAEHVEEAGDSEDRQSVAAISTMPVHLVENSGSMDELRVQARKLGEQLGLRPRNLTNHVPFVRAGFAPEYDTYATLLRLEERHSTAALLRRELCRSDLSETQRARLALERKGHAVHHLTNQFAVQLVDCFESADINEAFHKFKSIPSHTLDEEMAILTNRVEFQRIFDKVRAARLTSSRAHHDSIVSHREQIDKDDRKQFKTEAARSLPAILKDGVRARLLQKSAAAIRHARETAGTGAIPVTEILKSDRVMGVNNFGDTKVSQVIHDVIDHVWLFNLVSDTGLYRKFDSLFQAIGNPLHTDIFKREGETIASIGFGVRYWAQMPVGFVPRIGIDTLHQCFEALFDKGELTERHYDAFRIVRALAREPLSRPAQSMGFVFSNYITELDEQRRKHGEIKMRDEATEQLVGVLNPWSPDFLCFFVETHAQLLDSKNKHRDHLFAAHLLLEDFLTSDDAADSEFVIKLDDLIDVSHLASRIPDGRIEWISRHYGFTAFNDSVM